MSFSGKRPLWAAACLGLAAGTAFGLPWGWLPVQACLFALVALLAGCTPARGARALAVFAGALLCAGHAGFALSTPPGMRGLALLPLAALVLAHAACTWAWAGLALRHVRTDTSRFVLVLPSLWVAQEWLFAQSDVSIPWLRLGYVQAPDGPFAFALPVGGVLLASWLMLIANGLVVVAWRRRASLRPVRVLAPAAVCALLALGAAGFEWTQPAGTLGATLVQSGLTSQAKQTDAAVGQALELYRRAAATGADALVLTPQLAIPKTPGALPPGYLQQLQGLLQRRNADALLGMHFESAGPGGLFNGVLALGASGPQRYLKTGLFPFGEFMPLPDAARQWVDRLLPMPMEDTARPGRPGEPLWLAGHRAAIAICFEAALADAWRRQAATADVLINIASDSAADSRQLARQFRQIAQARALELQKPLLRTSDIRGTYAIDARGRITAHLPEGGPRLLSATVQTRAGLTPFARWGDALALLVAAAALALAALRPHGASQDAAPRAPVRAMQAGVVLPAATALLLIVAAVFYLMVNAGQTVSEKIRTTNAADAAAYSAGVVEARALNYDAYLNRAIVANEIAIAQMVSLGSWVNYFATASDNYHDAAGDVAFFLHPNPQVLVVDGVFGGTEFVTHYFGTTAQEYADYIVNYGIGAIITVLDAAVQTLALSQQAVHLNLAAGVRQRQVADDVVKAMDPNLHAEVVVVSHGFDGFTKTWSGDDRARLKDVTLRSRDPFSRERNWTIDSFDIPLVRRNGALKKRGGTELIGFDEWRAVDTLELHGERFGCGRFGLSWCSDVRKPVGWGAVYVSADGNDAGHGHHGNAYNENPTTAGRADENIVSPYLAMFSGLPGVREIGDVDPAHEAVTGVTVLVTKAQADTLTSGNAAQAKPSGDLALFSDHPAGGKLAALARAQVFFDRIAARGDGKQEVGSLYNPYWRVRLVSPTAADKAYAATQQGGLALP